VRQRPGAGPRPRQGGLRLPPGALCFEITETAAVANLSKVVLYIEEAKTLGCLFSLGDFGSGLSFFAFLKKLPVDLLKIDGNLVKDIADDPIDLAMVQAINAIGHVMCLESVAEYVASEATLDKPRDRRRLRPGLPRLDAPRPRAELGSVGEMPR
jgi:Amt family ammonium transporter